MCQGDGSLDTQLASREPNGTFHLAITAYPYRRQNRKTGKTTEFKDASPEQCEKNDTCNSPEEISALAKEEGYELSESELDQISGGSWSTYGVMYVKGTVPLTHSKPAGLSPD